MKESYVEGLATHDGPESCALSRKGRGEALTGVRAGRVSSREKCSSGTPTPWRCAEGEIGPHRYRETRLSPARSETPCTHGNTSHENREVLCSPAADGVVARVGKSKDARRR